MLDRTRQPGKPIPFTARRDARAAIARLGRCEDVAYSPNGGRIALIGLVTNRLLVLDIETALAGDRPHVAVTGFAELDSAAFNQPHGIVWVDDRTLILGNRRGQIAVVALPEERANAGSGPVEIAPLRLIGADGKDLVTTPGSLAVRPVGMGLIELLVCNNYVDHVTRHLIDRDQDYRVLASEMVIAKGMSVPDGIALSPCGGWIAISNHDHHNVLLFRDDDRDDAKAPDGILAGIAYPHGLVFSGDGKALLVADAGAPFVHVFRSEDGGWSGERKPSEAIRTFSDKIFRNGCRGPAEGGPKGVDLTGGDRVMVASCEEKPLAFFDMSGLLPPADQTRRDGPAMEADRVRETMARYLSAAGRRAEQESEAIRRAGRFEREALFAREQEIRALMASRSWRITAPLRRLNRHIRGMMPRG